MLQLQFNDRVALSSCNRPDIKDQQNNKLRRDGDGFDVRPDLIGGQLGKDRGKGSNDDIPPFPNN